MKKRVMQRGLSLFLWLCIPVVFIGCGDKEPPPILDHAASSKEVKRPDADNTIDLDKHPGKALHDAHCISCHDAGVYTRENRKVKDWTQLKEQVKRCNANLATPLTANDIKQITDYLNQAYYHFSED